MKINSLMSKIVKTSKEPTCLSMQSIYRIPRFFSICETDSPELPVRLDVSDPLRPSPPLRTEVAGVQTEPGEERREQQVGVAGERGRGGGKLSPVDSIAAAAAASSLSHPCPGIGNGHFLSRSCGCGGSPGGTGAGGGSGGAAAEGGDMAMADEMVAVVVVVQSGQPTRFVCCCFSSMTQGRR